MCIKKWTFRDKMTLWPVDVHVYCVCVYLVVNGDFRVGVSFIQRFDLTDVVLLWKLDHSEHHRYLRCQLGELQLTARQDTRREGSKISEKVKRREGKKAKANHGLNNWSWCESRRIIANKSIWLYSIGVLIRECIQCNNWLTLWHIAETAQTPVEEIQ